MTLSFQNLLCFSMWHMTMTVSCDWCVMVWLWCHINPKSSKVKVKEKEMRREEKVK